METLIELTLSDSKSFSIKLSSTAAADDASRGEEIPFDGKLLVPNNKISSLPRGNKAESKKWKMISAIYFMSHTFPIKVTSIAHYKPIKRKLIFLCSHRY